MFRKPSRGAFRVRSHLKSATRAAPIVQILPWINHGFWCERTLRRPLYYTRNYFKGDVQKKKKTWQISSKNSATFVNCLCPVLQLSSMAVNEAQLQYHTRPLNKCGAVFGRHQTCFSILDIPIKERTI